MESTDKKYGRPSQCQKSIENAVFSGIWKLMKMIIR